MVFKFFVPAPPKSLALFALGDIGCLNPFMLVIATNSSEVDRANRSGFTLSYVALEEWNPRVNW